jgi:citronellol/citronellal dehydrogenase
MSEDLCKRYLGGSMSLKNKTVFITGASRGIGLAIAMRAARDGANVVVTGKTAVPHAKLSGTIYSAAEEIRGAGGNALPIQMDVRDAAAVGEAVRKAVRHFGGIDVCVNNASAINLSTSTAIDMPRFDLMQQVNTRGAFVTSRACVPHLKKSANPHILTLSPPLTLRPDWFAANLPYTLSKYGMSMVMLGMAEEFREDGIACNCLWPRTTIATAAVKYSLGGDAMLARSRKPEIVADAAHAVMNMPSREFTGRFLIDDELLTAMSVTDWETYKNVSGSELFADIFVDPQSPAPPGVNVSALPAVPLGQLRFHER